MSGSILDSIVGLGSPEETWFFIHHVVYSFMLVQTTMRIEETRFVERLRLVVSVTILRSDDVCVEVTLSLP